MSRNFMVLERESLCGALRGPRGGSQLQFRRGALPPRSGPGRESSVRGPNLGERTAIDVSDTAPHGSTGRDSWRARSENSGQRSTLESHG